MSAITYHTEQGGGFRFVSGRRAVSSWLFAEAALEGFSIGELSIVFCDENAILEANRRYLNHDYPTDIITFDDSEGSTLNGDLLIGVTVVCENAERFEQMFHVELLRVMVHGVLHLMGYKDKTKQEQQAMRMRENQALQRFHGKIKVSR